MAGENPNGSRQRRFVLLAGNGKGPIVPFRSSKAMVRIRGLDGAGSLELDIDGEIHLFLEDGEYQVSGGQLAQATTIKNSKGVFCEVFIERNF